MKPDFEMEAMNRWNDRYSSLDPETWRGEMMAYVEEFKEGADFGYHSRDKEIEELKAEIERLKATS